MDSNTKEKEKQKKTTGKTSKTKNKGKNNFEPKWKAKKDNISSNVAKNKSAVKENKKKKVENNSQEKVKLPEERKSPSSKINKKDSGKKVDKTRLIDKYKIEKTAIFNLPSKEELDKIYEEMSKPAEPVREVNCEEENKKSSTLINKIHYNFLFRVCTLVVMILIFLVLCIVFAFKAIGYQLGGSTTYSEYTSDDYSVCTGDIGVYDNNCLDKDLDYISSIVNNIHATFNYEAVYSRAVSFKSKYYVEATLKVFDQKDESRIRYTKSDKLISNTNLNVKGEVVSFSTDVDVNFKEYKDLAYDYIEKTGVDSAAEVEVGLYLLNNDVSRMISSIKIPLTDETFMITSNNLDNQNQLVVSNINKKTIDPFYIFVSIVCLLMDILLFSYLANFIYLVKHLDNKYNAMLKRILREYDEYIVNTNSNYNIPDDSRVIEVETFEELLDARNSLEKPIVYERINNIKSKFYVEDDKTIYVFTMKDEGE